MASSMHTPTVRAPSSTNPFTTPDKKNANLSNTNTSSLGVILAGIDDCIRQWKAARHSGQAVLTSLSNTLLLRTHLDKARNIPTAAAADNGEGGIGDTNADSTWGALAGAASGSTVARVSVSSEARSRRLHSELTSLQDAMLAAAGDLRRHADDARRLHFSRATDVSTTCSATPGAAAGVVVGVAGAAEAGQNVSSGGSGGTRADHLVEQHVTGGRCDQASVGRSSTKLTELVSFLLSENRSDGRVRVGREDGEDGSGGGGGGGGGHVIGGGYGMGDVVDCAADVAEMLMKEALVTATVTQGVTDLVSRGDREALTIYAAAWMMQPYLDARRMKELQTMVAGVGARGARRKGVTK